jgi:integrase
VPLSRQALAIINELKPLARGGRYLFPSLRTRDRPMSDNTINAALRRLGERNRVRAAYNKAQRLPERRKMMQAWSDYLDGLRSGGRVVAINRVA